VEPDRKDGADRNQFGQQQPLRPVNSPDDDAKVAVFQPVGGRVTIITRGVHVKTNRGRQTLSEWVKFSPMFHSNCMRPYLAIILSLLLASGAFAQADKSRRDKVAAATAAAVNGLKEAVSKETVAPGMTVGTILARTRAQEKFLKTLSRAEQPGGPRWVDDQTCQVRLEISGPLVAQALVNIAATQPKETPIAADVLAVKLQKWNTRTFSATGSSTGATEIEHARPGTESEAWSNVTDDARRAAVAAAKDNAVNGAVDSVRDVKLPNGETAGDALKDPVVRDRVRAWLAARPVTQVDFRDDLNVGVQLAVPPAEFFDAFRDALRDAAPDAAAWNAVRDDFARRLAVSVGTASVAGGGTTKISTQLPSLPPAWTNQQIEADGAAKLGGSKLKCARAAENEAAKQLTAQIEKLPLTDATTIGQAAERDPQVRDAISRAASRGRTYKVEYDAEGGARVWVQLDLSTVWNELRGGR
jgi:hypothetical protein